MQSSNTNNTHEVTMKPTQFLTNPFWLRFHFSTPIFIRASLSALILLSITGCEESLTTNDADEDDVVVVDQIFNGRIDLNNLPNYANQPVPNYIENDNTEGNNITNIGATLGRVLFYDTMLSVDNTVSCASCHQQANAFGDPSQGSEGVNGFTLRQSMRLVNARFSDEDDFFWDERANSLEQQTTQPIQDHVEMGFSGQNGNPDIDDLIQRLSAQEYYQTLFSAAFGDPNITEQRMQNAMAQFIRSIQSFDSRYDAGRAQVNDEEDPFPNFTAQENLGKELFDDNPNFQGQSGNRTGGGLGCQFCHRAPEFDIRPNSDNNGVVSSPRIPSVVDFDITRSPSLRDMFNAQGELHAPLMHTGDFTTIDQVIDHYNDIDAGGINNLDDRLARGGGVNLNITQTEREALIEFLKTLTGSNIYTDEKWSDPFDD